jgi:hypothetical protein
MCNECEAERKRLTELMLEHPRPCIVCKNKDIVGAGTWIADQKRALAVGAQNADRIFAFCLCDEHAEPTEENEKLIMQSIVRSIRSGSGLDLK